MKNTFLTFTVLLVCFFAYSQNAKVTTDSNSKFVNKVLPAKTSYLNLIDDINCKIKGKLNSGKSTYLKLVTDRDNPFMSGIKIPVVNGTFEYDLHAPFAEKYTLILGEELEKGAFRPISFFVENGEVDFKLYETKDFDKNSIVGGLLTDKMLAFKKEKDKVFKPIEKIFSEEIDSLWDSGNYFSEEYNRITEKIKAKGNDKDEELNKWYKSRDELMEKGKAYTSRALFLNNKMDSIQKLMYDWEAKYIAKNINIVSYSILLEEIRWYKQNKKNIDINHINQLVSVYAKKYPLHPYTKQIADIFEGIKTAKVGGMFVDFSAPNIDGKMIVASDIVAGKVALLDMWASWCGPCRVTSKSYIPMYEKYKDKGFVILGVANEYKNTNAFKKAMEKDKYPWLNLIELENANRIWDKYNISNSGGSTFLVNSKGVVVAVNPSAQELDKLLEGLLN